MLRTGAAATDTVAERANWQGAKRSAGPGAPPMAGRPGSTALPCGESAGRAAAGQSAQAGVGAEASGSFVRPQMPGARPTLPVVLPSAPLSSRLAAFLAACLAACLDAWLAAWLAAWMPGLFGWLTRLAGLARPRGLARLRGLASLFEGWRGCLWARLGWARLG